MWTKAEYTWFKKCSRHAGNGDYKQMLRDATTLQSMVKSDPLKLSYVEGCRVAVALRHLGRKQEAEQTFSDAYDRAEKLDIVIASYILNDWASMFDDAKAVAEIKRAIVLRKQKRESPDHNRSFEGDIAYFEANQARRLPKSSSQAANLMGEAKTVLKRHAYGKYPFYKTAYLVVMIWELELHRDDRARFLKLTPAALVEVTRQGRAKALVKSISSAARRTQIRAD